MLVPALSIINNNRNKTKTLTMRITNLVRKEVAMIEGTTSLGECVLCKMRPKEIVGKTNENAELPTCDGKLDVRSSSNARAFC
jgi:hypothetical protein